MRLIDSSTKVREGEALDALKIEGFLKDTISGLRGNLTVSQFPSGYSNLTYLLTIGDREWVLRRPPFGKKAKTAHDMGREYRILKALKPVFPYCPKPIAYTEDTSIIGSPFYVMERLRGIILRKDLPPDLSFTPEEARQLCEKLLDVQIQLHAIDYKKIGLENYGKPKGYVERQVVGWSDRYRAARTDDAPDCEKIMAWIQENMPPDCDRPGIIHNDYRFDNAVLDAKNPMKIIGILDWEMATIGDPFMDLGNSLAYWVQSDDPAEMQLMRVAPTNMEGALTRKEIIRQYSEKSGRLIENFEFYYCFGLFRLAVIAQQIYYRYYHGQTKDERFKTLIHMVRVLDKTAHAVIKGSTFPE
ncbi:MAG: phosphotransferase family protein [Deltaproteobacteria bacterium]|nr:phosphotransferase family protein [Deltaproteobacteria bacterium]